MEIILKPQYCAPAQHQRWVLTTNHPASSYGEPVLIHPGTGKGYGPGDILEAYPNWGYLTAREVVKRMIETSDLKDEERALVNKFISSGRK
jgi:hypothetical protein